jgi:PAS domain-containing protein
MIDSFNSSENLGLRYFRLFEAAQDGILILNYDTGLIEDANPFIINLLKCAKEDLIGKELWEMGFISDKTEALEIFKKIKSFGYVR